MTRLEEILAGNGGLFGEEPGNLCLLDFRMSSVLNCFLAVAPVLPCDYDLVVNWSNFPTIEMWFHRKMMPFLASVVEPGFTDTARLPYGTSPYTRKFEKFNYSDPRLKAMSEEWLKARGIEKGGPAPTDSTVERNGRTSRERKSSKKGVVEFCV